MEWKNFKESDKQFPEEIVEQIIDGFSNATQDLAELVIKKKGEYQLSDRLNSQFQFDVNLTSGYLSNYVFRVFSFGYNIELYPVNVLVDPSIISELNTTKYYPNPQEIVSDEDFKNIVELIFASERFNEIVSGLMKVSKKNILPF